MQQEYSLDSARLATAGRDETVRVWDPATGKELRVLKAPGAPVTRLTWSHDGQRLAAANRRGRVMVWDTSRGELLVNQEQAGRALAWSKDGRLACGRLWAKQVRVWDADGRLLATTEFKGTAGLAWSCDGRRIAMHRRQGTAIIWDAASADLRELGDRCSDLVWSPSKPLLAYCVGDKVVICNGDGEDRVRLPEHPARVNSLAWSPDGKRLLSASDDRAAIMWDVELVLRSPQELAARVHERSGLEAEMLKLVNRCERKPHTSRHWA